ncbi:MAG: c-type cytochrome domain-containing protein [Flavobacteriales bacterium]
MNKLIFSGVVLAFCLQSCTKAIIEEPDKGTLPPIDKKITYNPDVQTIMYNNCITCHGGSVPSAGLKLNNFADVKNSAQNGTLIQRMNADVLPMPPSGKLPAEVLQILDKWKADGFLEN